jgi:hypothetical protein
MRIQIKKFGDMLISRPEGRDAGLVIKNQFIQNLKDEVVVLDFEGVRVLTPSWLDEIVQVIIEKVGKQNIAFENTQNSSVRASIESVREQEGLG